VPGAKEDPPGERAVYGPYLTLGLQLALTVVVFFFLGRWLDGRFGTAPWLMLAGLAVGVAGGLTAFLLRAFELGREEDREQKRNRK
jgi:ATP synthase protein I